MAEIIEFIGDGVDGIKSVVGKQGFMLLVAGGALFGLYNLLKDNGSDKVEVDSPIAYGSYPDAVTNADVIISTLENTAEYNQFETMEQFSETRKYLEENFTALQDYITEGFDKQEGLLNSGFELVQGQIEEGFDAQDDRFKEILQGYKDFLNGLKPYLATDTYEAGTVTLHPDGQENVSTYVTFTKKFARAPQVTVEPTRGGQSGGAKNVTRYGFTIGGHDYAMHGSLKLKWTAILNN